MGPFEIGCQMDQPGLYNQGVERKGMNMTKKEYAEREIQDCEKRIASYQKCINILEEKKKFLVRLQDGNLNEGEEAHFWGSVPDEDPIWGEKYRMRPKHYKLPEER